MKRFFHCLVIASWMMLFCGQADGGIRFNSRTSAINLKAGSRFSFSSAMSGFNGWLIKDDAATISGSSITFDTGAFEERGTRAVLDGSFAPASNQITLGGNKTLLAEAGRILRGPSISGTGNRIEGQPVFSSAIIFDASATLTLALQGKLDQNV